MKTNLTIQLNGVDTLTSEVEKLVKEDLKANGVKTTTIKTLDIYFKPNEKEAHYVALGAEKAIKGCIKL